MSATQNLLQLSKLMRTPIQHINFAFNGNLMMENIVKICRLYYSNGEESGLLMIEANNIHNKHAIQKTVLQKLKSKTVETLANYLML